MNSLKAEPALITMDELNMYVYCGEYYRAYKTGSLDLWDSRQPIDIMIFTLCKWLVAQTLKSGQVPEENDLLLALATARQRMEAHGYPVMFASKLNDLLLVLLDFRKRLCTLTIKQALISDRYSDADMTVMFTRFLETQNELYVPVFGNPRQIYDDPNCMLQRLLSKPQSNVIAMCINNANIEYITITNKKAHRPKIKTWFRRILTGIRQEVYIPIWKCSQISCPHYKKCSIGGVNE